MVIRLKVLSLQSECPMMTNNLENNSWTLLGQWVAVMGHCQGTAANLSVWKENVKALCTLGHEEIYILVGNSRKIQHSF